MTSRDRVELLTVTLPIVRADVPTWAGENAGSTFLATINPDEARALYRQGSYHELERILAAYRKAYAWTGRKPNRHYHLAGWYWEGTLDADPAIANQAIDDLDRLMSAAVTNIRIPQRFRTMWWQRRLKQQPKDEHWNLEMLAPVGERAGIVQARGRDANEWMLRQRDQAIRELSAKGWTQAAIADKHGISQPRVAQILAEAGAAA